MENQTIEENLSSEKNQPFFTGEHTEESLPMWKIVWEQFKEHRLALYSLILIALLVGIALCAPLISALTELNPNDQDVFNRYKPAFTTIAYSEDKQEIALEKWSQTNASTVVELKNQMQQNGEKFSDFEPDYTVDGEEFVLGLWEITLEEDNFLETIKQIPAGKAFAKQYESFSTFHLLGTDELGRDVLMRLIYGARVSIGIGVVVAFAAALIGLFVGSLAGFYGGLVDSALMRVTDSLLSLPLIPVLIVFAAIDLSKIPGFDIFLGSRSESVFKLIIILCAFSWMTVARLVRGSILSLKEQDFIHAAKILGAKDKWIILRHVVPNVLAPLLVAVTLNVGQSILSEAALSFLGLGIQPPLPSWGNMLFNAQEIIYQSPLLAILPGFFIFVAVICFNFVGDGLQDALDPKAIRR